MKMFHTKYNINVIREQWTLMDSVKMYANLMMEELIKYTEKIKTHFIWYNYRYSLQ